MRQLKDKLKTISKSLTYLSNPVEKIINQVDKLQPKKAAAPKKTAAKKKVAAKKVSAPKKTVAKKKVVSKKAPDKQLTVIGTVLNVIKRSRKGITISQLKEKTAFNAKQLSNVLHKLSKKGEIQAKSRGLYVKK